MKRIVLVLDCGATNVRTIAVEEGGHMAASASRPNTTRPDPYMEGGLIWDLDEIWGKLMETTQEVVQKIDAKTIAGVTVTTFGVDCAPLDAQGNLAYPIIAWACQRTAPIMENIGRYIPIEDLYYRNGVNPFSFNTINKLIWFGENRPDILEKTRSFAFISSILLKKLCGNLVTERTMAGTSMLTDLKNQEFSEQILQKIGFSKAIFPNMVDAGEKVGTITAQAQQETHIPENTPVLAAGHDTQFAIFGSGAGKNQPVLSSGTWEILMVRTPKVIPDPSMLVAGVTTELDAQKGLYNPGLQWLGSGVLEWVLRMFYGKEQDELHGDSLYEKIISEAERLRKVDIGMNPDFLNCHGNISGIGLGTKREEIYLAALSSLAHKTKENLGLLEHNCGFKSSEIICVGGGSKNRLWNKERAKALGIPVWVTRVKETTVLGAALYAFSGLGMYASPDEARQTVDFDYEVIEY
jgi:L-fuculokinase